MRALAGPPERLRASRRLSKPSSLALRSHTAPPSPAPITSSRTQPAGTVLSLRSANAPTEILWMASSSSLAVASAPGVVKSAVGVRSVTLARPPHRPWPVSREQPSKLRSGDFLFLLENPDDLVQEHAMRLKPRANASVRQHLEPTALLLSDAVQT